MDISIAGYQLQPLGSSPAKSAGTSSGSTSFTYQLSENHKVIVGSGHTVPMRTENTLYFGGSGDGQDVLVTLTEDSTDEDPIVRIQGHSLSGEFDFIRHIKDIDPSNASYAEMCALMAWEERVNPSGQKGLLLATPLGMGVGNVTQKQNFVDMSSQYLASGKFSQSIADQTERLLELYKKLMQPDAAESMQKYSAYRRVSDMALINMTI